MFVRIFVTTALALLGIYAFWDDALGGGHILNPFGIMFLLFAALVWFSWQMIREAFKSAKNESNIPMATLPMKSADEMERHGRGRQRTPIFHNAQCIDAEVTPRAQTGDCLQQCTVVAALV
jgi:hypothetical protein